MKVNKTIYANSTFHHKVNVTWRLLMGAIPCLYASNLAVNCCSFSLQLSQLLLFLLLKTSDRRPSFSVLSGMLLFCGLLLFLQLFSILLGRMRLFQQRALWMSPAQRASQDHSSWLNQSKLNTVLLLAAILRNFTALLSNCNAYLLIITSLSEFIQLH